MNYQHSHILTPNKNKKKYFGVDFMMDLLNGSNPIFKYSSTTLDANPVYHDGPIEFFESMYDFLDIELSSKPKGSIIGIFCNPDIYAGIHSLKTIIGLLEKHEMGLFLETTSMELENDLDILQAFNQKHPLLISIPVATVDIDSKIIGDALKLANCTNILQKLKSTKITYGIAVKPIIPFVNDDLEDFKKILETTVKQDVSFIYPSFSLKFDSAKIREFYNVIDLEFPENMVKYQEVYGKKTAWESQNMKALKKNFVIICKSCKVKYAMKDIIALYKPNLTMQLKLF